MISRKTCELTKQSLVFTSFFLESSRLLNFESLIDLDAFQ